jgi:Raf kinase inhibitor-like YbhB/YbcL family protein
MKRLMSLFMLTTLVALAMSGCGGGSVPTAAPPEPTPTPAPPAPTSPPPAATPTPPAQTPAPPAETPTPPAEEAASPTPEPVAPLEIFTSAFEPGGGIPGQYSCDGDNISPPVEWSGVPEATQSLLLVVYDLDAGADLGASVPQGFVHWVVYNIPPSTTGYPEGMPGGPTLADGALQGNNDFGLIPGIGPTFPSGAPIKLVGYDGPCPGDPHRYAFTLYALDSLLDLPAAPFMTQVLGAMEGNILAQAEVVGVYSPQR